MTHTGVGHPVPILDPAMWAEGQSDLHSRREPVRAPAREEREERVVMVVDDSLSMRRYLGQLVGRLGYRAVEARDGQDALELLEDTADEPSLVLLDLEMPRMDGYELMERLRSDRRFQHVPRVVLSSRGAEKHRRRATESGADGYLVKPVAESQLEATLTSLAGGSLP